jgi:hypothetical protein
MCRIQAFQQGNRGLVSGSVRIFFYALKRPDWLWEFIHPSLQWLPGFLSPEKIWPASVTTHIRRLKFCRLFTALTLWTLKGRHTFISNALRCQKGHCFLKALVLVRVPFRWHWRRETEVLRVRSVLLVHFVPYIWNGRLQLWFEMISEGIDITFLRWNMLQNTLI